MWCKKDAQVKMTVTIIRQDQESTFVTQNAKQLLIRDSYVFNVCEPRFVEIKSKKET